VTTPDYPKGFHEHQVVRVTHELEVDGVTVPEGEEGTVISVPSASASVCVVEFPQMFKAGNTFPEVLDIPSASLEDTTKHVQGKLLVSMVERTKSGMIPSTGRYGDSTRELVARALARTNAFRAAGWSKTDFIDAMKGVPEADIWARVSSGPLRIVGIGAPYAVTTVPHAFEAAIVCDFDPAIFNF
jgi:hypothetical protein